MSPPSDSAPVTLNANQVRGELFAALDPVLALVEKASGGTFEGLLLLVQLDPGAVRVVKAATEGGRAVDLGGLRLTALPDGGAAVRGAVERLAAGILSTCDGGDLALDLATAWRGRGGGLVAVVDPALGSVRLLMAAPGRDLSEAVELGAIAERLDTMH